MRTLIAIAGILATAIGAGVIAWRRDPRIGSALVNTAVNPWLLEHGMAGGKHSEIGPLEHIGRRSGIRRLTLVHPEPTATGCRFVVPLGTHSEWAKNVLAAGRCRVQLHEHVHELAEPRFVSPAELKDLPCVLRAIMTGLGFRYLVLETVSVEPGTLEAAGSKREVPAGS
jgi:deazaflavin-dependent oxidoreductase (nitroreductase family)